MRTEIPGHVRNAGKTLEQAVVHDPSWFFWCAEQGHFLRWGMARHSEIVAKAKSIIVGGHAVAYRFDLFGKLVEVALVSPLARGEYPLIKTRPYFDFSIIEHAKSRASSTRVLRKAFKALVLEKPRARLTKRLLTELFADDSRFAARPLRPQGFVRHAKTAVWVSG